MSVSTVQPSLNQEFLCKLSKTLKCLCALYMKKRKVGNYFIWKVKHETISEYEKTPVDPRLLNDILWGLKALCAIEPDG